MMKLAYFRDRRWAGPRQMGTALMVLAAGMPAAGGAMAQDGPGPGGVASVADGAGEVAEFDEHLGEYLPPDIVLTDEQGQKVVLGEFIDRPTILMLVYYSCPGICTPLLNEVADVLGKSSLDPGRQPFQLLTVSFEPKDDYKMAGAKRANYLKQVGRPLPPETWRFFTGDAENLARLTSAVGFRYKRAGGEYTHPGGLIILSPEGKIVRYLYGIEFLPFDFQMGIYEAAQGKVTPTTARLLRFCFSYDPAARTYVFNLARVVASVMLISVALLHHLPGLHRPHIPREKGPSPWPHLMPAPRSGPPAAIWTRSPDARGLRGWLTTIDHKRIGLMYAAAMFTFFMVGVTLGVLIRLELLQPGTQFVSAKTYNSLFTLHGVIMIFLFIVPGIPAILGNFILPLQLGAEDVAFPRLNLLSWYVYMVGAVMALTSLFVGGGPADTGWTFYAPYAVTTETNVSWPCWRPSCWGSARS